MRTCRQMGRDHAGSCNNKGILNEYRKPRLVCRAVRKVNRKFAEEQNGVAQ